MFIKLIWHLIDKSIKQKVLGYKIGADLNQYKIRYN